MSTAGVTKQQEDQMVRMPVVMGKDAPSRIDWANIVALTIAIGFSACFWTGVGWLIRWAVTR